MRWLAKSVLVLFALATLLTLGCSQQRVVCNPPYILVGTTCCLDQNNNSVCDKDEIIGQVPQQSSLEDKVLDAEQGKALPTPKHVVAEVFDGDTFTLSTGEKIRLLGINAPEKEQPYSEESTALLMDLVLNKEIQLVNDVVDKDQYGRLLRHVFVNSTHINKVLVEKGLATTFFVSPNNKYQDELLHAEENAEQAGLNLWKKPIPKAGEEVAKTEPAEAIAPKPEASENKCSECLTVSQLHFNAEGNDCYNLNDEYVVFKNGCSYECDLTSWTVKDEANHIYAFPSFTLGPYFEVTLYTGFGQDTATELYWKSSGYPCNAIWNNDGDTLFLRDTGGNLAATHKYGGYK